MFIGLNFLRVKMVILNYSGYVEIYDDNFVIGIVILILILPLVKIY